MNRMLMLMMGLGVLCYSPALSHGATVKSEQINPADPEWKFKTIPGPSKSDIAQGAKVTLVGNRFEPAGADGFVLVNGMLPGDSLDLTEAALLSNANVDNGNLMIDLGRAQPAAAVASYSWHEWNVDQGSRGPQVYRLYGSAAENPDPNTPAAWTKIADVDTRPNKTGAKWNGQHGVFISDANGSLGEFRYLLFALQRTRSPLQPSPNLTGTLFSEIDVHTAATLAEAGDAIIAKPAKIEHVWVVFKTHLDIGYTATIEDVLKKYRVNMMDGALKVIDASGALPLERRFSWTLAGWPLTHVLGPLQEPDRRARIEQAVRSGAIAFHALPFTFHTETDDLEDLTRGLGFSSQLARKYGRPMPISGKMTDVPCHSWVWPTLLSHAGVRFLQLGCNGTSAFVRVPPLFWWEGPDGSRILCNYTRDYGSGLAAPRGWPSKNYLAMQMTGDNHGPPSVADVENLRRQAAKNLPGVQIHFGTLDDFAKAVIAENPELPVVRADMPDTWIHGWLSMPQEAKAARQFRALEPALDSLDTHLRGWGVATGDLAPALAEAYEQSNLYSEHTFGPFGPQGGSWKSGTPRYLYGSEWKAAYERGAYKKYEEAFDDKRAFARRADVIVRRELTARLDLLAKSVNADGKRIVVYNALPWPRSGVVSVEIKTGAVFPLTDLATGKQITGGWNGKEFFFLASDVPANGYKAYALPASSKWEPGPGVPGTPGVLDTPFYRAIFDLKRGGISSLIEKKTNRELVEKTSAYAMGQFMHERFDSQQMLAFHNAYGRPGYNWPKGNLPKDATSAMLTPTGWKITIQSNTAMDVATLTAADTLGLAKGITLVFTFPRHQPSVEVEWHVADKTPDPLPEGGWLCFPFAVAAPQFQLGRLGGAIDPAKDIIAGANRHYICLNTGLTIAGSDKAGVGLCPMDSPCVSLGEPGLWKFSLDYTPKKPAVFVNLYNNEWNTNFPEWQGGSWSSRVRFWPTADLVVPSWEAREPLLVAYADGPAGKLPPTQSGLSLSRPGVLVTAFGQNPDGAGTLLRVWEQSGKTGSLTIALPKNFATATPVNLRGEKNGAPISISGGALTFDLHAYAPASFLMQ